MATSLCLPYSDSGTGSSLAAENADEGIAAEDGFFTFVHGTSSCHYNFTLPGDIGPISSVRFRGRGENGNESVDPTVRVVNGAAILAADNSGGSAETWVAPPTEGNSPWVTFSYVETDETEWVGGVIEIESTGSFGDRTDLYSFDLEITYTPGGPGPVDVGPVQADGVATTAVTVGGTLTFAPDIKVQRGTATVSADGQTATLGTAVASLDNAFVILTSNRHTGGGSSTGNAEGDDLSVAARLTGTSTITFERPTTTPGLDQVVAWEVWEYVGPAAGANEFVVRGRFDTTETTGSTTTTTPVSGVANRDDCVPFIQGTLTNATVDDAFLMASAAHINSSGSLVVSQQGSAASYHRTLTVVVEFTGANWTVLHGTASSTADTGTITLKDGSDGTGTTTAVSAWAEAFIASWGYTGDSTNDGIADHWPLVEPGASTSTVDWTFHTDHDGASDVHWVHVLNHADLNVTRYSNTDSSAGDFAVDITSAGLTDLERATALGHATSSGTGSAYARGWKSFRLNTLVQAIQHCGRSGNTMENRLVIVDWAGVETAASTSINVGPTHADSATTTNVALAATRAITAQADSATTVAAVLTATAALAAQADSAATAGVTLTAARPIAAQADSTATVVVAVGATAPVAAQADGTATAQAAVTAAQAVAAQADGAATAAVAVAAAQGVAAQADGTSAAAVVVTATQGVAAQADGTATAAAAVGAASPVSAQVDSTATVEVALTAARAITTQADSTTTTTTVAAASSGVAANAAGAATAAVALTAARALSAQADSTATATATLGAAVGIGPAHADSATTTTVAVSATASVSARADSTATAEATLAASARVAAQADATTTTGASVTAERAVTAQADAVSATTVSVSTTTSGLSAQADGVATATATLTTARAITAQADSATTATVVLRATRAVVATADGTGTVNAAVGSPGSSISTRADGAGAATVALTAARAITTQADSTTTTTIVVSATVAVVAAATGVSATDAAAGATRAIVARADGTSATTAAVAAAVTIIADATAVSGVAVTVTDSTPPPALAANTVTIGDYTLTAAAADTTITVEINDGQLTAEMIR